MASKHKPDSAANSLPKKARGPLPRNGKTFTLSERASLWVYYPTSMKQGFVSLIRKVLYPTTFERKINMSKASFTKFSGEFQKLNEALEQNDGSCKVYLTSAQCACITEFEKTGQRYLTITFETEEDGEMVMDTSRTINLNAEEVAKIGDIMENVMDVLKFNVPQEGAAPETNEVKIHVHSVMYMDKKLSNDPFPEAVFFSRQEAEEYEVTAKGDKMRFIREDALTRPNIGLVAKVLFTKEYERAGPFNDYLEKIYGFRDLNRVEIAQVLRRMMIFLRYPEPLFSAEIVDLFYEVCGHRGVGWLELVEHNGTMTALHQECLALAVYDRVTQDMERKGQVDHADD